MGGYQKKTQIIYFCPGGECHKLVRIATARRRPIKYEGFFFSFFPPSLSNYPTAAASLKQQGHRRVSNDAQCSVKVTVEV